MGGVCYSFRVHTARIIGLVYCKKKCKVAPKDRKVFAINNESHVTESVIDEVSHAEVAKGVSAALVLDHAPSQGQGEGGIWTRSSRWGWRDRVGAKY